MTEDLILLLENCIYLLCSIAFEKKNPLAAGHMYITVMCLFFLLKWNDSGLTDPWNRP